MIRILASIVFLLLVAVYATPGLIAIWRAPRRWPLVVAIDVLLGWTVVGWLAALVMALELRLPKPKKRPKRAPAPPVTSGSSAGSAAPVREHIEPPRTQDEAYARWLDGGAGMNA